MTTLSTTPSTAVSMAPSTALSMTPSTAPSATLPTTRQPPARRRAGVGTALVLALAIGVLAGCGGSKHGSSGPTAGPSASRSVSSSRAAGVPAEQTAGAVFGGSTAQATANLLRRDGRGHLLLLFTVANTGPAGLDGGALLDTLLTTYDASQVTLADYAHREHYYPLSTTSGRCLCSKVGTSLAPHSAQQFYAWFPAPPADVTHLDVNIGKFGNLRNVPVASASSKPPANPTAGPTPTSPPFTGTPSAGAAASPRLGAALGTIHPLANPQVTVAVLAAFREPGAATTLVLAVRNGSNAPYYTGDDFKPGLFTGNGFAEFGLTDPVSGTTYRAYGDTKLRCLCTEYLDQVLAPGGVNVGVVTFPALPASVSSISVGRRGFSTATGITVTGGEPADLGLVESDAPSARPAVVPALDTADIGAPMILPLIAYESSSQQTTVATGPKTQVTLSSDVLFDFGKADLTPAARTLIAGVAAQIDDQQTVGTVTLVGYTDSIGSDAVNIPLSRQRAQNVADAMQRAVTTKGLSFAVSGAGSANPVAPNTNPDGSDNPAGRAKNRRVTVAFSQ